MTSVSVMYSDARDFVERARARSSAAAGARVMSLDELRGPALATAPRWQLDELVGRLAEVSGQGHRATYSAVVGPILEAQVRDEPVAWLGLPGRAFFPPDLDDNGVDLEALVMVWVRDAMTAARAADTLLRSGGFGLVLIDLGLTGELPMAVQGRLVGLAQRHEAGLIVMTDKPRDAPSIGSIVSLRAEALRERLPDGSGFRLTINALKDKRRGPGWQESIVTAPFAGWR